MLMRLFHDLERALQLIILVVEYETHFLRSFSQGLILALQEDQVLLGQGQIKFDWPLAG